MPEFLRRLQYLFNRRRLDQELAEEMNAHREMAAEHGGDFGNTLRLREEARDVWGWTWIERLGQDLRYAARMLRKSPGFSFAAVVTLAVGIGVNVAAFGFFNLILFKPLPVRDPGSLVRLERRSPQRGFSSWVPYPEMAFVREYSRTLSAVLATFGSRFRMEGEEKPVMARFVTPNFFRELGAAPRLGRLVDPAIDGAIGAEPVAVLSHAFWLRHFGGDPLVIGKVIRVNEKTATVVGVLPHDFSGLDLGQTDIWMPIAQQPYFVAGSRLLTDYSEDDGVEMWGRLRLGLTAKVAEDETHALLAQLYQQHPTQLWENETLHADPAGYARVSHGRNKGSGSPQSPWHEIYPVIALVSAFVLLILAVASGNLGSLLLARSVAREREISIRISVGAGRARLIRQLFTESLLLAFLGSIAGLALGFVTLRTFILWMDAPTWLDPMPDGRVALFSFGIGALAAVLFGLTPALQITRQRQRANIARQFLIGAQVAASCVLLIVSGLLMHALDHAIHFDPGFEYQNVALIEPGLDAHGYTPEKARAYLDELQNGLQRMPGVQSVALTSVPPLGGTVVTDGTEIAGRQVAIHVTNVSPTFFKTMGIPILRGRSLQTGETNVIVIGESFAKLAWPGKDALGRKFTTDNKDFLIVGIAGTARLVERQDPDAVEAYFPLETGGLPSASVLVKTAGPTDSLLPAIHAFVKSIRPDVTPFIELLKTSFRQKIETIQNTALVVSLLGAVALSIACLGIVGLVAYSVSQRTKEIGLRMALGAKPAHVLSIVLQQFSRTVFFGLLVGILGAAALSQLLRRELYGISNLDPLSYLTAAALFLLVAGVAALLPARRALRIDPMRALRYD